MLYNLPKLQIFSVLLLPLVSHSHSSWLENGIVGFETTRAPFTVIADPSAISWIPTGELPMDAPRGCLPDRLDRELIGKGDDIGEQAKAIQKFFDECGSDLAQKNWFPLIDTARGSYTLHYNYELNSKIQNVWFTDADGNKIRAQLYLQSGEDPRPIVIVKCGMQCDLGSRIHMRTLSYFGDEGGFHVLLLPSISGADYWEDNEVIAMGGFDEGRQIVRLTHYLQSDSFQYSDRISGVHVLGVSLGGHAVYYTALYHDVLVKRLGIDPFIRSFATECAVVDLHASIGDLFREYVLGEALGSSFWSQVRKLAGLIPLLGRLVDLNPKKPERNEFPEFIESNVYEAYRKVARRDNWLFPPFEDAKLDTLAGFWHLNRFLAHSRDLESSFLVWASINDPIVRYRTNSYQLQREKKWSKDLPIEVVTTEKGGHCATEQIYGWFVPSTILRNYFLSKSPELLNRRIVHSPQTLPFKSNLKRARFTLRHGEKRLSLRWIAEAGSNDVRLEARFKNNLCHSRGNRNRTPCERTEKVKFKIKELGLEQSRKPQNQAEAEAMTRFLNGNIRILDEKGQIALEKSRKITQFQRIEH